MSVGVRSALRAGACVFAVSVCGLAAGPAHAGEEAACDRQYSLEEQLLLEWAALGGDPHAQYAIAQCAFPKTAGKMSADEKLYALKWVSLAACESTQDDEAAARDRRLRALREDGDISFRRFGGLDEDERLTKREKVFVEYRAYKTHELEQRYARLKERTTDDDARAAYRAVAADFARMGPHGLLRLAELSACSKFGATPEDEAAAWSAAKRAWASLETSSVYGKSDRKDWSVGREAEARLKALDASGRDKAAAASERLLVTSPERIAKLEDQAALASLQEFSIPVADDESETPARVRAVPLAVQYALETAGHIAFVNGPDNDYGPATIEAVSRLQSAKGRDANRWLSNAEIRDAVCDAAAKNDPISLYNVAVMYQNGWGFPVDLARARLAADRASVAMKNALGAMHALPEWKQADYREFAPRIEETRRDIAAALATEIMATPSEGKIEICR